ncbi:MAG: PEP-CTERM sorting domain-containing protein [Bryobacterales bacterium]|nr:PEP-CTERM sorting domain-containing protein [Bryobacterales bacterium]
MYLQRTAVATAMSASTFSRYRLAFLAAAICAVSLFLPATTITFNGLSGTPPTYAEAGATFSLVNGGSLFFTNSSPTGSTAMGAAAIPFGNFRADFTGTVSMVSVDLGDLGGNDADELFLQVFSASNLLLGSDSDQIPASVSTFRNLSVSAPGIAYAIFGVVGINGNSGVADNFTFAAEAGPGAEVPEPGSAALFLLGTTLLWGLRRKHPSFMHPGVPARKVSDRLQAEEERDGRRPAR